MTSAKPAVIMPLRRMTQAELDAFLEKAADILWGNVDHSEFRGYAFLLFFKRISDIFEKEVRKLARTLGEALAVGVRSRAMSRTTAISTRPCALRGRSSRRGPFDRKGAGV